MSTNDAVQSVLFTRYIWYWVQTVHKTGTYPINAGNNSITVPEVQGGANYFTPPRLPTSKSEQDGQLEG